MELIRLLPDIYDNNETMQLLQGILSQEVTTLDAGMYHTIDQCYVGSSSEDGTLSRYERLLGISPDTSKSERYRKERIKARYSEREQQQPHLSITLQKAIPMQQ